MGSSRLSREFSTVGLVAALALAACSPTASVPSVANPPAPVGVEMPNPTAMATAPADQGGHVMSPPTAAGQAHPARDASLPALAEGATKQVTIEVSDNRVDVGPGVTLSAWTFGGAVPGPVIHVRQGDTVQFTLVNHGSMGHSIDFHSARTSPSTNYKTVLAGQSYTFSWQAQDPGVFLYHCGTAPILQHLAEGMYGAVVVDPVGTTLPKVDHEYVFVQSEFYLAQTQGQTGIDYQKALAGTPDLVVFNGYANQYSDHPLAVKVGDKIRVYFVNAGPNNFSALHVVGTIFDHVYVDGNPLNDLRGLQTTTVAPGEGTTVDFTLSAPGNYPMVTHSFADATKGAVAVFQASAP